MLIPLYLSVFLPKRWQDIRKGKYNIPEGKYNIPEFAHSGHLRGNLIPWRVLTTAGSIFFILLTERLKIHRPAAVFTKTIICFSRS